MALQNTDNFLVSRAGSSHKLAWSDLQTDIGASLSINDAFVTTGDPVTGVQSIVPYSAAYGIQLPVAGVNDYNISGALRYNSVSSKIELYDGAAWVTASGNTAFSSTPPTPASEGDIWYDVDDGRAYVYYNDGDSNQWVEMNPSWNGGLPPGIVTPDKISEGGPSWTTAGYVGVGTDTPSTSLHLDSETTDTRITLENAGSSTAVSTQIYSQNNDLVFTTSGSERLRIDSLGGGVFAGKLRSASTLETDPGTTLATKDYVDVNGGGQGTGGGTTITQEYSGPAAWGYTTVGGGFVQGLNIASMSNPSNGVYDYTFSTPMPSAQYSVQVTSYATSTGERVANWTSTSTTGFTVEIRNKDGTLDNTAHSFTVHALNALPPMGGTGADGWGLAASNGTLTSGFNIDSVTRVAAGTYDYVFTNAMPSADYAVILTPHGSTVHTTRISSKTNTGFRAKFQDPNTNDSDTGHSAVIHATNATLPVSFTQEQILASINNPGASAWAYTNSAGGLVNGLNLTVSQISTGQYQYTFVNPLGSDYYSVQATAVAGGSRFGTVSNITNTGFQVNFQNTAFSAQDVNHTVTVFATNALPATGGTGADAFALISTSGSINNSFNIASVTRTSEGTYDVVFTNPMPTSDYVVVGTSRNSTRWIRSSNLETTGFQIQARNTENVSTDTNIAFVVHATNATLPDSFTELEIQNVVDLAQSGATNPGASAWGSVTSGGEILDSLNVASIVKDSGDDGTYDVTFATPMPNDNYAVTADVVQTSFTPSAINFRDKTATGFRVVIRQASAGTLTNRAFTFVVFSTNALPLKGGVGADAWAKTNTNGTLASGFNFASVTRTGAGRYDYVFTTPMPDNSYSVVGTSRGASNQRTVRFTSVTETGFTVVTENMSGTETDVTHSVIVHATNAVLPETITQEQLTGVLGAFEREGTDVTLANIDDNVGIGTNNPGYKLCVEDSDTIFNLYNTDASSNDSHSVAIQAYSPTDTYWNKLVLNASSIDFNTYGATRARLTSDGRLGIGSDTPAEKLVLAEVAEATGLSATGVSMIRSNYGGRILGYLDQGVGSGLKIDTIDNSVPTERIRITGEGRVGINTTDPIEALDVSGNLILGDKNPQIEGGQLSLRGTDGTTVIGNLDIDGANDIRLFTVQNNVNTKIGQIGGTGGACELWSGAAMRLKCDDGGHIMIHQATSSVPGFGNGTVGASFEKVGDGTALFLSRGNTAPLFLNCNSDNEVARFRRSGTQVGSISVNTTSTSYNTSSDYRMKENVVTIEGAVERVMELKPCRFNFIATPETTVDGFLAHEAQAVVPESVTGTKDAVDKEGKPDYQSIDQSKLVPLLTAGLQETIAKVEELESTGGASEIATLKAENAELKAKVALLEEKMQRVYDRLGW